MDQNWSTLWNELHHQGTVGIASYAAVPYIVRIAREQQVENYNPFGLVAIVEVCRDEPGNPPVPAWLKASYEFAWKDLFELSKSVLRESADAYLQSSALSILALHLGLRNYGKVIAEFSDREVEELIPKLYAL